jgi:hypothetical protein
MENYLNLSGKSGVSKYELGFESITVQFNDGAQYLYNYGSAGKGNIEQMKVLAINGSGLNSFISREVKELYARKIRGKIWA